MSLTVWLIAKLSRVDEPVARRALSTAQSQDEMSASPPADFAKGREALAYALAIFIERKPIHFYLGLTGLFIFPLYLLVEVGAHFYGK
ncbi:hypothetical protein [Paraburkholderia sp. BCC1876]|uniref:hypothetical protein n=1 Tax=Paraburkholderia sp. BCC1876 TaxID=2676303 RepID=UPI001591C6BF|nr:hypothetical protein [Paraburkholderia sp. BCC1876]